MAVDYSAHPGPIPPNEAAEPDDLGARLQALRMQYGLSQRELARRAGLTNSAISLIEQNQVSPSVASLAKLVGALGMTLGEFFATDPTEHLEPFYRAADLMDIGVHGVSLRLVGAEVSERALQVLHERYPPGADTGEEMLTHAGEEAGVVIRGRIRVTVGAMSEVLGAGDAYYFKSRLPHRFCNEGDEICELVSAATPPTL